VFYLTSGAQKLDSVTQRVLAEDLTAALESVRAPAV
jgi:hypothetical protein